MSISLQSDDRIEATIESDFVEGDDSSAEPFFSGGVTLATGQRLRVAHSEQAVAISGIQRRALDPRTERCLRRRSTTHSLYRPSMPGHAHPSVQTSLLSRSWLYCLVLLHGCSKTDPDSSTPYAGGRTRDPAVLARAAVVIGSCLPDDGVNRSLSHLQTDGDRWWHYGLANAATCIAAAGGGCDALTRCIGLTIAPAAASCSSAQCDGERAYGCGDGLAFSLDCAKLALHCDEKQFCSAAPSVSCESAMLRCGPDGIPEYCAGGVMYHGANCAALGLECSGMDCVGSGEPCKTIGSFSSHRDHRWDGMACADTDTLQACVGGRTALRACAEEGLGFTCQSFNGEFFCGLASECLPAEQPSSGEQRGTPESCEGDTLVFCNAGRIERQSCTELGFARCEPEYGSCAPGFVDLISPD